jgi:DNA polymerase III delta subunit
MMRPADFFNTCIKNRDIPAVVLFTGSETYWKNLHVKALRSAFLPDSGTSPLSFFTLSAAETSVDELLCEVNSMGFFSAKKIVHLRDAQTLSSEDHKRILEYRASPNRDCCLILDFQKLDARTPLGKDRAMKTRTVLYEVSGREDVLYFIRFKLKSLGNLQIEKPLERFLIAHYPRDLGLLSNNLEKIAAHGEYTSPLRLADSVVADFPPEETDNFAFSGAILDREFARALRIKNVLMRRKGSLHMLIGLLRWQFQTCLRARQMLDGGLPEREICSRCRIPAFKLKTVRRYAARELSARYQRIAECDYRLKSASLSDTHLFDMLIYHLCR